MDGIAMPKAQENTQHATRNLALEQSEGTQHASLFLEGLRLYWRGSYWHSHEAWEDLWRESQDPERSFLQALIQINAALIHSEKGHWRGVRNLLTRVLNNLPNCPKVFDVDVPSLRRQVEVFRAEAEALLNGNKKSFNWRVKPRLAPDGVTLPARERLRRAKDDLPDRVKARLRSASSDVA
jgi:hypothetical protein